jgi:glutamyl-tRNA synthetase
MTVRTRYAPSPTGHVHIGNIRTAIFNWLFARHAGGRFLLRIEDTDRERSTPEAVRTQLEAMEWLGLAWDEEPVSQSSRMAAHLEAADRLLSTGAAYKVDKGGTGQGEAVVFRMPGTDMAFRDEVKGELRKAAADLKDFVIVRSNGTPVFHLANVVDDIHMGITHVIRGDDHVENTYRHVALFQALDAPVPKYAHLPMIVNAQGKPYSKRDGAAYVGDYRDRGYLPDALFNYLALLGWSPGDDREIMARAEMIERFTLDRVQSSAAQMDLQKLQWMNGEYLRALPAGAYREGCQTALRAKGLWRDDIPAAYFDRVLALLRDRLKFFNDINEIGSYFFTDDYPVDEKAARKRLGPDGVAAHLAALRARFSDLADFRAPELEAALRQCAQARGLGAGDLIHPVRVAVSGLPGGPGLFDLLETLGRERVLARLARATAPRPA